MPEGSRPVFNLEDPEKMGACGVLMPLVFDTLQAYRPDVDLSGDDVLDFFALCIATIVQNDTHIVTPRDREKAIITVKTLVKRWEKSLRDQQGVHGGPSSLAYILEADRAAREGPSNDE